ncbi:MAG: SF1B family DNA helicase RecD2 [Candidatus Anammoxibacter sp.]
MQSDKENSNSVNPNNASIEGIVERIVYVNENNLYTVAVIQENSKHATTTIVGNFPSICPGETLLLKGKWIANSKYGEQFKVNEFKSIIPSTVNAIQKYLGSGLIKGIGEKFAEKIVKRFGANTLDIIEKDINRLSLIEGVGKKRIASIKIAWDEQKEIRELMIFLQGCGVGGINAVKIYKQYGDASISILKENPYKLAMDITGIGFKTADSIAQKMGIPFNSSVRVEAGLLYVLHELANDGHVFSPHEELTKRAIKILDVKSDDISKAILELSENNFIVIENVAGKPIYLKGYYLAEASVCKKLIQIVNSNREFPSIDIDKAVFWVSKQLAIHLSEKQELAIRAVIKNQATIITGGPGVGKTTIINSIIKILEAKHLRILLAAPTGRAAKKMAEATGRNAMTIHRLLKFNARKRKFEFNERNLLSADVFMIDEVSMIDINLMSHLLKAIPCGAKLILAGDIDQLPSVGPGNVLKDIINSDVVTTIRLTEIFRQAEQSLIVENAHKINKGEFPILEPDKHRKRSDFYFIETEEPKAIASVIKKLCKHDIPSKFGFDSFKDIQVLTPMHKGDIGASALNNELQEALNPQDKSIISFARKFCVNDKVMQIRNNYDKDVFNGDIGRITEISKIDGYVSVEFDKKIIKYTLSELDELVLSYAITIHKSQGNEYTAVIIPISTQHYIMLQRNLIYTAITRGKKLVIIVGTKKAIRIAVLNNKVSERYTRLKEKLQDCNKSVMEINEFAGSISG